MASNRKETIGKCIESLRPIRDRIFSELIIVDTRCDEELHNELCKVSDKVVKFQWCNDFSAARNAGLAKATGQWFLYLDDDEWFTDCQEIIEFFQSGDYQHYGAATYIQRNYLDMEGTQYTDSWVGRMIRLEEDTKFTSKIHEQIGPVHGAEKALHAVVDHYGYVYSDQETKQKHFERNKTLLEEMIEEEPKEIRWKLQLLLEYRTMDDFANLKKLGIQLLELYEASTEGGTGHSIRSSKNMAYNKRIYLGSFYAAIIMAELGEENYGEAREWGLRALNDMRNVEWTKELLYFSLARSCFFLAEYAESENYANEYLKQKEILRDESFIEQQKAPFISEALDKIKQKEIYSILICAGLKRKDTTNLRNHLPELHWEEDNVYVFEKIVETLIEIMCEGTNEQKVELVYAETLQLMYRNQALWQYYVQEICTYEEAGNNTNKLIQLIQKYVPEALERREQQSENATKETTDDREMRQLAEQVKEQIRLLIANGMTDQAKEVIRQLQKIIPNDVELEEILHQL